MFPPPLLLCLCLSGEGPLAGGSSEHSESVADGDVLTVRELALLELNVRVSATRGDPAATARLLRERARAEWTVLAAKLPPSVVRLIPPLREPPAGGLGPADETRVLETSLRAFRKRDPQGWARLMACDRVRAAVATACSNRGDGRPIVFSDDVPTRGVRAQNWPYADRTEVMLRLESPGRGSGVALASLLFEIMNSADHEADMALKWMANRGELDRREYVINAVRLEAAAALRSQMLLAELLSCSDEDDEPLPVSDWCLFADSGFAEHFLTDPPLAVEGYPWTSFGRTYDFIQFHRAAAAGDYWLVAAATTRIRASGRLNAEEAGHVEPWEAYIRRSSVTNYLGLFFRLPEKVRVGMATRVGVMDLCGLIDRLASLRRLL